MMMLSREQLYLLVWNHSLGYLGGKLGVSGNAVAKACRKRHVPVPGRGPRARVRHGQVPERTPLPEVAGPVASLPVREEYAEGIQALLDQLTEHADDVPKVSAVNEIPRPAREPIDDGSAIPESQAMPERARPGRRPRGVVPVRVALPRQDSRSGQTVAMTADLSEMPQFATLRQLAERLDACRSVERLLVAIEQEQASLDAATRAPVQLWLQAARRALGPVDPVTEVVKHCQRIAAGTERPFW